MGLFDRLFGRKEKPKAPVLEEEHEEKGAKEQVDVAEEVAIDPAQAHHLRQEHQGLAESTQEAGTEESAGEQATAEPAEEVADVEEQQVLDRVTEYPATGEAASHVVAAREQESRPAMPINHEQVEEGLSSQPVAESEEEKYQRTLKKTRTGFGAKLNEFFANFRSVDEDFFEELEELLITSDVGVQVASHLTEELRYEARLENAKKPEALRRLIIEKLVEIYEKDGQFSEQIAFQDGLTVMLFVGVNGVGKTTSIGKLAYRYKQAGKKVMLVAADTFRAGAVAQLVEWGRRVDVPVVTGPEKSDPASVVFDGMEKAMAEQVDILMIDTAGRLQNKDNLMAELEKIGRIIQRSLPDAPHETLLALDASTGQNALVQAKEFSKITPLTGLVLTKLDGTARGGVVLAIRQELDIPVKLIGFGEKIDDIGEFHSESFMRGLLEGLV
ncbi:signal recognition particle-docking protein FtsY [Streptococcus acidominimus]|uniref:Signal recognition particle receptor FtsY n=1 Tax=Streptococcus acidominimus TaxID=1326 RepID=A0A4Y9FMU3_STRAI|nr:signal recognition particle-docking protein FtsY [Streptococcus acidominimus]MBF0819698.1 signal recognition particle-docking protein FtsY [Streptococcus acidominimus]MBF0839398.1 signal recognition particle-docking protein FtsY [Streptococcus acidominimus]MBF0846590.1 signal recognition particle-docking protein FtsY [Streptococcus danieliae]TFU29568.1 signal recognition particle-docking protein FtsY [Streptococcus acidominimus]